MRSYEIPAISNGFVVHTSAPGPTHENGRFGKTPTIVCGIPFSVMHHRHIGGFFFLRQKVATANRSDAEHIEIVRRHLPAEDLHRIAEPGEPECGDVFRAEAVEDRLTIAIMLKARHGDRELEQVAFARVRIHVHESLRLLERQSAQKQVVDETENGSV